MWKSEFLTREFLFKKDLNSKKWKNWDHTRTWILLNKFNKKCKKTVPIAIFSLNLWKTLKNIIKLSHKLDKVYFNEKNEKIYFYNKINSNKKGERNNSKGKI